LHPRFIVGRTLTHHLQHVSSSSLRLYSPRLTLRRECKGYAWLILCKRYSAYSKELACISLFEAFCLPPKCCNVLRLTSLMYCRFYANCFLFEALWLPAWMWVTRFPPWQPSFYIAATSPYCGLVHLTDLCILHVFVVTCVYVCTCICVFIS
jgi:hypothetical protein